MVFLLVGVGLVDGAGGDGEHGVGYFLLFLDGGGGFNDFGGGVGEEG